MNDSINSGISGVSEFEQNRNKMKKLSLVSEPAILLASAEELVNGVHAVPINDYERE